MNEITLTKTRKGEVTWNVPMEDVVRSLATGVYNVTVRRKSQSVSNRQRNLLRKWFACISSVLGMKANEVHDWYCQQFLSYRTEFMGGAQVCHGTSGLTVAQMSEFMSKVKQHAKEQLAIELPEVDDAYYRTFNALY